MAIKMNHYYSNEWCTNQYARSQEELQSIASMIRQNCKVQSIDDVITSEDYICTVYTNDALGIRYWIKDKFGHISEIDEARSY